MNGTEDVQPFGVSGTVLLTGGSSGLGLDAGRQLAAKGANVIIIARKVENSRTGIASISESATNQRFHDVSADLRSAAECERTVAEATAWNNGVPPDIVWCCQGYSHPTPFINTPVEKFQDQMDSNYFSCLYIAHAVLNRWLRPGTSASSHASLAPKAAGNADNSPTAATVPSAKTSSSQTRHLIFTSSFVSFVSFAGYSPYSPSKIAPRSLAETLASEMHLYAGAHPSLPCVRIHTVYPATIKTSGLDAENLIKTDVTKMLEEGDEGESAADCARAAIRGLQGGGGVVTTRWMTWAVWCSGLGAAERGG
ncbi:NAD(P)-binding protein [Viridothelium virens]|uniref:NAD(P)-binding protein n=1 Tax=Viridothelium virens TaxID=1048519 RepID=A0A6A6HFH8_VIRVR|nr:NAD(P)-binding protein [Viridothelium virens]